MKFRTSHPRFRTAVRLLPVLALWARGILAETIDSQYRAQVEQWRQQREEALKAGHCHGTLLVEGRRQHSGQRRLE